MDTGNARKPKILIVDDEPHMRLLIRTAIEKL
jgi:CheY-like chemotaxis protein